MASATSPLELRPSTATPLAWRMAIFATVLVLGGIVLAAPDALGRQVRAGIGVICFIGVVAGCSTNLRGVNWRTVGVGMVVQVLVALFILKTPIGYKTFAAIGDAVSKFLDFTMVGAKFVFGPLADQNQMRAVFGEKNGFVFAFVALPTIIFVSSFFTVLYYFGVLQFIVRIMARGMMRLMGTSGAESLSAVANVFMGQTEAPLIVKPYVPKMTRSEMLALMVGGMATISGGVMAAYIAMGADKIAILATSVMAAPCGLYLSKLMLPETEIPETHGSAKIESVPLHSNAVDAAAGGASDGLHLALNVAAMIIAFLAFIALFNALLGQIKPGLIACGIPGNRLGFWPDDFSLTTIFSTVFYPVALLMGSPVGDAGYLADLLGTKLVSNEFVAYANLTSEAGPGQIGYKGKISAEGLTLATYALTGFANVASIGIQLGGIGSLAPSRRADLASLGGRALLCGFLATLINASLAGILMAW